MPFIPHTQEDTREMLDTLGVAGIDELFNEIPAQLRVRQLDLPDGMGEMEISRLMRKRADENRRMICFAGAGAYDHHVPAAVWEIASRGEFYSAYTPYQAEASQGTLQVLYEYQTMMASLTGLDVSNASLYDGASALAEAILMAVRASPKSRRILLPKTVHPIYRQVVKTLVGRQRIELIELPYDPLEGRIVPAQLQALDGADIAALVIPQPNFFGILEEVDELTDWAARNGALAIGLVNPLSLGLLNPPGAWGRQGAAIACGDGQPLGAPLSGGGPYFGFLCCRHQFVHQLPGRLVGATSDRAGKPGFTLTLQAREQHIRRGRATSNICTNQGLMATAATIHLALLGPEGLRRTALRCHDNTRRLLARFQTIKGIEPVFSGAFFHEVVFHVKRPAAEVLTQLAQGNILGGYDLSVHYPELGQAISVCATEMRTLEEIDHYAQTLARIMDDV
jgi:glycine dehydrogenase subunit 1